MMSPMQLMTLSGSMQAPPFSRLRHVEHEQQDHQHGDDHRRDAPTQELEARHDDAADDGVYAPTMPTQPSSARNFFGEGAAAFAAR